MLRWRWCLVAERHAVASPGVPASTNGAMASLDQFARGYMDAMHAPGMTVALVSGDSFSSRVYDYSEGDSQTPVTAEQPFWIGSICKSFVGLVAMQLRDEGKLDLHKPVLEIVPDLPFRNDFGPITTHHLLMHTSGLPHWLQLFSSDPIAANAADMAKIHAHVAGARRRRRWPYRIGGELQTFLDTLH